MTGRHWTKTLPMLAAAALAGNLMTSPVHAEDEVLYVYNWSDYIAEDTIQKFEEATGIKVTYDVYDSNDVLEAKLLAGNSGYDVVVPSAFPYLERQVKGGVYQKLDKSMIPNFELLDPGLMKTVAQADPGNEHAAIYMWGTTGIGYNKAKIEEIAPDAPTDSWDMVFDPEIVKQFKGCGVEMLDAQGDMIPIALNYLGLDPNSHDEADLQKAQDLFMAIRPYIRTFNSSEYINDLANGDACLVVGWSGDILQARDRADEAENSVEVNYVIPKEGTLVWFDNLAVPKDAPHPENAMKFINFMLSPEVEAANTNYVAYANGVPSSKEFIDEDVKNDTSIYPDEAVQEKLFVARTAPTNFQRLMTRAWTKIRTGQ